MKKTIKIIAVITAIVIAVGAFAACAGNKPAGNDPTGNETAAKVKTIDISLTDELYAFGVSKEQPELLEKTNEYIAKIKADGTMEAIIAKYFSEGGTPAIIKSA